MRINLFKAKVHVDIFDDRMEIYSPGGMVDGTFIQNYGLDGLEKADFTGVTTADICAEILTVLGKNYIMEWIKMD